MSAEQEPDVVSDGRVAGAGETADDATGESNLDSELISRLELIESQPLERRAAGFDQLADALLSELQRSDRDSSAGT